MSLEKDPHDSLNTPPPPPLDGDSPPEIASPPSPDGILDFLLEESEPPPRPETPPPAPVVEDEDDDVRITAVVYRPRPYPPTNARFWRQDRRLWEIRQNGVRIVDDYVAGGPIRNRVPSQPSPEAAVPPQDPSSSREMPNDAANSQFMNFIGSNLYNMHPYYQVSVRNALGILMTMFRERFENEVQRAQWEVRIARRRAQRAQREAEQEQRESQQEQRESQQEQREA